MGVGSVAGFLGNRRIGIKLGFIMFVPTLATVIVGANGLVSQISNANSADRARSLASLSADAGTLVHALQDERTDAAIFQGYAVKSPPTSADLKAKQAAADAYKAQKDTTDKARSVYQQQVAAEPDLPSAVGNILSDLTVKLGALDALRDNVNGTEPKAAVGTETAITQYNVLISR